MIAGASFTDDLVTEYADRMSEASPHTFSALGLGGAAGRPVEATTFRFRESQPFPKVEWPPQNIRYAARLLADLVLAVPPQEGVGPVRNPSHPSRLKEAVHERLLWGLYQRQLRPFFARHDLYHWHCLDPAGLPALHLIPPAGKVILTPWGSDLYRTSGVAEYTRQLFACRRASAITLPSAEMRDLVLAKFGRELSSRIRIVRYGVGKLDVIDRVRCEGNSRFTRVSLPPGKLVVCIGNNSSRFNQHVPILRSLANLSPAIASRITLVLPMAYGDRNPSYVAAVRDAIHPSFSDVLIITDSLSSEEIAQLRCSTDVLIHLPASDAFSATMCESLYAGAVVITGAWLPYSPLRSRGVHYREVSDVADTSNALGAVVEHYEREKRMTTTAPPVIRDLVSWQAVVPQWRALYDELLSPPMSDNGDRTRAAAARVLQDGGRVGTN